MNRNNFCYMPILKWKQGEQGALVKCSDADRKLTLPLLELQPLKFKSPMTTSEAIKQDIEKMIKNLQKVGAETYPVAIDSASYLLGQPQQNKLLGLICSKLAKEKLKIIPVIYPQAAIDQPIDLNPFSQFEDIILRIKMTMFLSTGVENIVAMACKLLNPKFCRLHILIDMDSVLGEDSASLESRVEPYIKEAIKAKGVASITLAGGSFPYNLMGIEKGTNFLLRVEWLTWLKIRKKFEGTPVIFGDYAVTNPKMLEEIDPTKINPSAAIRYALKDKWMLLKAGGTRKGGFSQYNELCKLLTSDGAYLGSEFSYGDGRYDFHANTKEKTGNLSTWRRDATSHHLALTVRNCAKLLST